MREVAKVQLYGQQKYGEFNNYRKGMEVSRNLSCAIRHIADYLDGNDNDSESGHSHLAHATCRLLFVLENLADGVAIEDRYTKCPSTQTTSNPTEDTTNLKTCSGTGKNANDCCEKTENKTSETKPEKDSFQNLIDFALEQNGGADKWERITDDNALIGVGTLSVVSSNAVNSCSISVADIWSGEKKKAYYNQFRNTQYAFFKPKS